ASADRAGSFGEARMAARVDLPAFESLAVRPLSNLGRHSPQYRRSVLSKTTPHMRQAETIVRGLALFGFRPRLRSACVSRVRTTTLDDAPVATSLATTSAGDAAARSQLASVEAASIRARLVPIRTCPSGSSMNSLRENVRVRKIPAT